MVKSHTENKPQLTGFRREERGDAPAKHLRTQGLVPGVVYGKAIEPMAITVNARELTKLLHTKAGEHALLTLRIEQAPANDAGQKTGKPWERAVLVKDIQHHPVDGHLMHVDFHAIVLTERLRVKVPVELKGVPVGVRETGGVLEHFLRDIEVECLPTNIPKAVEFDISQMRLGDTIHVRDLAPPADVKITTDPEGAIASVQTPKEEKPEEEAAVTEPEVITEKKVEPGEGEAAAEAGKKEPKANKEEKKEAKGE